MNGEAGLSGNVRSGGGSGGTCKITTGSLIGHGTISSHGGSGFGGTYYDIYIGKLAILIHYNKMSHTFP